MNISQADNVIERVYQLAQLAAVPFALDIVRVRFYGTAQRPTLQVMAEKISDGSMSIDDCANLSRELSVLLDVHAVIEQNYVLEVSSPGIDRPLVRAKDFARWQGFLMRCETIDLHQGRRRFKGMLYGLSVHNESEFVMKDDAVGDITLPIHGIRTASLIITDELLKKNQQQVPA